MIQFLDVRQGCVGHHPAVGDHRDPVADRVQRVQVVGDQEHGQPQRFLQGLDQAVEGGRADRVEAGGGFVQEQQWRIQRQRTGQAGALAHAAGQLRGQLVDRIGGQAGQLHFQQRQFVVPALGQLAVVFLQRHLHVLAHGQRGEQGAVLEQHAGVALDVQPALCIVGTRVAAEYFDLPGIGHAQAEDRAHQHRFAGTGAADHAQDFAAAHIQVQVFVHGLAAEAVDQATHADGQFVALVVAHVDGVGEGGCAHVTSPCA